jgi:hypothetical protein
MTSKERKQLMDEDPTDYIPLNELHGGADWRCTANPEGVPLRAVRYLGADRFYEQGESFKIAE